MISLSQKNTMSNSIGGKDINFIKELYVVMKKYNIHRIYTAGLNNKKMIVAQQLLSSNITNFKAFDKIFEFLDKHAPWLYFNIIFKNHIYRYKLSLKKIFNKYGVQQIKATSFNLDQGIYILQNNLCIKKVDIIYKDGEIFHVENLSI